MIDKDRVYRFLFADIVEGVAEAEMKLADSGDKDEYWTTMRELRDELWEQIGAYSDDGPGATFHRLTGVWVD